MNQVYQIPNIEEKVEKVSIAKFLSTVDLTVGDTGRFPDCTDRLLRVLHFPVRTFSTGSVKLRFEKCAVLVFPSYEPRFTRAGRLHTPLPGWHFGF